MSEVVQSITEVTHDVYTNLGANHHMWSTVTLRAGAHLDGKTRTQTGTWFGGYTGGVNCLFFDSGQKVIGQSNIHQFGVDGTAVGRGDRTDWWGEDFDASLRPRIADFVILQFWAPKYGALANIVRHAVDLGKELGPLIKELKDAGVIPR